VKVAQGVAEYLKREGVEFILAYPVNPIIEAAAVADIRTVIVRQERIGLHMADAVSRLSSGRQIGVFTMQSGPGTENAFGGVAQAFGESAPILVLPMGYGRRASHVEPNFNAVLNFQHVTTWCEPLSMGKAMPEVMRRAFTQLRSGRPAPVMVEVPADVFAEDVPDDLGPRPSGRVRTGPDPDLVRDAAEMLAASGTRWPLAFRRAIGVARDGLWFGGGLPQIGIQLLGAVTVSAFIIVVMGLIFKLIDAVVGLRVPRNEELKGLDVAEHGTEAYGGFQVFTTE